ncbi:MAG: exopolyphosphatase [Lactobacillus kalixensis]|uniref:exopolyphosphatase n=1 Tax=Lactobacillus kalixensis TaxID=227944 RepID=UPI003996B4AD
MKKKLFGLIYMSSYKIQLNIVDLKDFSIIEKIDSPSFIQADNKSEVFEQDMAKICTAIIGFKEALKDYRVKDFKFYGNSQLIDSLSASYIADQIKFRTGLEIEWLSSSQIIHTKVLSGIKSLHSVQDSEIGVKPTYLLSLGSAMINLSLFENDKFVSAWSLPLGPREIQQINQITTDSPSNPIDVINDYIRSKIDHLARQLQTNSNCAVIIQHTDVMSNHFLAENDTADEISRDTFENFYEQTIEMPSSILQHTYQLEPAVAEHTLPNLIVIKRFIDLLNPNKIFITDMSVITGLLMEEADRKRIQKNKYGNEIIMTYAQNMAARYLVDPDHASTIQKFAVHIFDRLRNVHLLPEKDRLLLSLAATVADIGSFVNQVCRYEQSAEIVDANKLIGLSDRDNEIVSEICRYQTTDENPSQPDIGGYHYRQLDPQIQLEVVKLSAILRIATALDASHKQKIKKIVISLKKDNQLIIRAKTNADITLERWSFNKRAQLFEDVFGIKVSLKQEGMNRR